ncbi:KAP family P-loop NTPase fold protein [Desulfofustis limnaeus]|uniref:EF-hand domain-containing protein n=1 Tax=Desulfofustis limnaeus TaxID=2740163 RepID=A0ABM7WBQ7_9BACT|nr:P-loop NTPase fold protein [Desulfofustis limnaeus]BDD88450.1 hypothetical protein DPPLL_28150 [Desulfofustis limnaeus]
MNKYFRDKPIDFEAHSRNLSEKVEQFDRLGIANYAIALSEFIQECSTPMTIGIQGDWGIGKTSTLNLIKAYLTTRKRTQGKNAIIWFNTWHYSMFNQDEFLGAAVINGLLDIIKEQFDLKEGAINQGKAAIGRVLKSMAGSITIAGVSINPTKVLEADPSFEDKLGFTNLATHMLTFRQTFQKIVDQALEKQGGERLVIFVDDLDRVKPVKALELLESLKNFLDVERCVFVLAVDYEVVQIGMADKLGQDIQKSSGKSFFDKIIQLPFTMPSSSYSLDNYIESLLEESGFVGARGIKHEHKQFYAEITATSVGRNPRSIKRVINYAVLLEKIRSMNAKLSEGKVTMQDRMILYSLICMQVAWPEVFDHFVRNPSASVMQKLEDWEYLDSIPNISKLYARTIDVTQLKSNISSYADLLFELVDEDHSGAIGKEEFERVFKIMKLTRLTAIDDYRDSIEIIIDKINNNGGNDRFPNFINSFKNSRWKTSKIVDYKTSGSRYATIVMSRKQVGSIVTTQRNPILFRIDAQLDDFLNHFGKKNDNLSANDWVYELPTANQIGFGDIAINIEKLENADHKVAINVLNMILETIHDMYKPNSNIS